MNQKTEHEMPDWPPQASAIGLPEGERRYGSTGQLFEVKNGRWERLPIKLRTAVGNID